MNYNNTEQSIVTLGENLINNTNPKSTIEYKIKKGT
jgi:hypothetical protein